MRQLYCFLLILISIQAIGQEVSFVADCNATDVVVGNAFRVSFRLENADIKNINFPNFDAAGFRVLQGPASEINYSYINGQKFHSEAYTFILMANKTGDLQILPAKIITSKGQTLYTKTIKIKSVAAGSETTNNGGNSSSDDEKILFRVEPSTTKAITGEQITLNYKIYTQKDLTSIEITQEPNLPNVYAHNLRFYDQETRIEVINGQQYASKIIQSKAIFPSKEGELVIEPAVVTLTQGRLSATNPFARQGDITRNSNPITIHVSTLDKVPKSFTGGVGDYAMETHIEKNAITTDEAIKLTLRIVGKGDVKQILAPPINFGKGGKYEPFDIYPPVVQEEIREGNGFLGGIKEFHYTLNPQELGVFKLKPTFSYYDTKKKKMVTLDTLIEVEVTQGQRKLIKRDSIIDQKTDEKGEAIAVLEFKGPQNSAHWKAAAKPIFGSLLFWIICLLPGICFAGLWAGKFVIKGWLLLLARRREKGRAERMSEKGMLEASRYLEAGETKALFEVISTTLKNYLAAKLRLSTLDMEKGLLNSRLAERGLGDDMLRQLDRVFKVCEETIFAGQDYNNSMQRTYDDASELLEKLTEVFK